MWAAGRAAVCGASAAATAVAAVAGTGSSLDKEPLWRRGRPRALETPTGRSAPCRCEARAFPKFHRDWDARHPTDGSIAFHGRTRVLLFVRHGQYETKGGPGYGRLTDFGREQARMAGRHIAARMRADPAFKRSVLRLTSSALDRAVETADLMQREIEEELAWVDVPIGCLPAGAQARVLRVLDLDAAAAFAEGAPLAAEFVEAVLEGPLQPMAHEDARNLLQPRVQLQPGSRIRVRTPAATPGSVVVVADLVGDAGTLAVHSPLQEVKRLDDRFCEWSCSGCKRERPPGDVHWSDDAEQNAVGFCDACFAKGTKHRKMKEGDTCARVTEGDLCSALRAPNDKNLNEADVDISSVLMPEDALYEDYGIMNSQILKDHAAVEAAFYAHLHRSVDHKRLRRRDREDVIEFAFAAEDGSRHERRWTAVEFAKLQPSIEEADGKLSAAFLLDENAGDRVEGRFQLVGVDGQELAQGATAADVKQAVDKKAKKLKSARPEKQVEIFVVHQNIIRYMFLRALQFDTTAWLNFGGSNCTMTQLRVTRKGDVICDFFADHGSAMPVSHYTFNKSADV